MSDPWYLVHGDEMTVKLDASVIKRHNCFGVINIAGKEFKCVFTGINGLFSGDLKGEMRVVVKFEKIEPPRAIVRRKKK